MNFRVSDPTVTLTCLLKAWIPLLEGTIGLDPSPPTDAPSSSSAESSSPAGESGGGGSGGSSPLLTSRSCRSRATAWGE